ncbi:uncharacterized protein METZ01_LOCUS440854 [marine metagenome]|uniref:Uncharacterized protein n=1 Tax=marine metagenome TaxID=408172 RepID=A0A382YY24_9ZZZZ
MEPAAFSIGIPTTVEKTSSFCHSEKPCFDVEQRYRAVYFSEPVGTARSISRPQFSTKRISVSWVSSFSASAKLVVGDQHHPHYY